MMSLKILSNVLYGNGSSVTPPSIVALRSIGSLFTSSLHGTTMKSDFESILSFQKSSTELI